MSDYHEGVWAEMAVISRRMARIEIALTERILRLEAEVAALKGAAQADAGRTVYPDAREINWREQGMATFAIDEIMKR